MREFPEKGRGIVTTKKFQKNDFLLSYCGPLLSKKESREKEVGYYEHEEIGSYMYWFEFSNKTYW